MRTRSVCVMVILSAGCLGQMAASNTTVPESSDSTKPPTSDSTKPPTSDMPQSPTSDMPQPVAATICNGNCYYVTQAGSGSKSGADWNNAYAGLPSSFVRDATYFVAGGTYGSHTFSTPASSTSVITIKKAVVADHGTSTGWSDTMGSTQAIFGQFLFLSSYWVVDGQVGDGASVAPADATPADYGFAFSEHVAPITIGDTVGPSYTDFTFKHIYALATTSDVQKEFLMTGYQIAQANNITISHCMMDGWQGAMFANGQGGATDSNWIFEYNIALNASSTPANHGEWIDPNDAPLSGLIVRYNIFKGHSGVGGATGSIVANNSPNTSAIIYGNVFDSVEVGNGIITGTSVAKMINATVYNNTFLNVASVSGPWVNGPGSGNIASNNLLYNMAAAPGSGWTCDYDAFFSTSGTPSEAHGETGSGDPFTDAANMNYTLKANTTPGLSVGSAYNVDPLGHMRSTWTRGAFEFTP